jgi:hypothetical protein
LVRIYNKISIVLNILWKRKRESTSFLIFLIILYKCRNYIDLTTDSVTGSLFILLVFFSSFIPEIDLATFVSSFTRLWFDWIKWLIFAGALTIVAEKTQDQVLMLMNDITYFTLLAYFGVNVLSKSIEISVSLEDALESKFEFLFKKNPIKDILYIMGITIMLLLFIGFFSVIRNWDLLLKNFVTKLPIN